MLEGFENVEGEKKRKKHAMTIFFVHFPSWKDSGAKTHKSHNDNEETLSLKLWSSSSIIQKC